MPKAQPRKNTRAKKGNKRALKKKVQAIIAIDTELNDRNQLFCQFFVFNDELRSNGTHCYAEAYGINFDELDDDDAVYQTKKDKKGFEYEVLVEKSTRQKAIDSCAAAASRLLRNVKVQKYLVELRNEFLTEANVDSELAKVIMQNGDLAPKVAAIKEYNKLRKRTDPDSTPDGPRTVNFIRINIHGADSRRPGTGYLSESEASARVGSPAKS